MKEKFIRVGMDVRNLNLRSGFSRIVPTLLENFDEKRIRVTLLTDTESVNLKVVKRVVKKPENIPWRLWINSPLINRYLEDVKIFFGITNTIPLFVKMKKILYIWDIYGWLAIKKRYYEFIRESKPNELFTFFILVPLSIIRADLILTPSVFTKKNIIEIFRIRENKIMVVKPGIDQSFRRSKPTEVDEVRKIYKIDKPYTLVVGNFRYHRNYRRIAEAFRGLQKDFQLVICGYMDEKGRGIFKDIENVIYTGNVSDDDLRALYSGATFLTHVSLMEGFGLPPLEAMGCGCPVLSSNVCSLPEVCSNSAYYVNPESIEEIREGMKRLFEDSRMREELVEKGYKNIERYEMKRFAQEITNIFFLWAEGRYVQ